MSLEALRFITLLTLQSPGIMPKAWAVVSAADMPVIQV